MWKTVTTPPSTPSARNHLTSVSTFSLSVT